MKFIGRKTELKWLEEMLGHSKKKLFPVAIYGPRRVGKTTLVSKFIDGKKAIYFFVNETKSSHVLAREFGEQIKAVENPREYVSLDSWDRIFAYLIEQSGFEIIILDEFQNFQYVEKSVFGTMQHLFDRNENGRGRLVIMMGSSTGLLKGVFEDYSAALYGRLKTSYKMQPLSFCEVLQALKTLGHKSIDDAACFYFVFGGYPKYLAVLEDFGIGAKPTIQLLETLFFQENALLQDEVLGILRTEFGSRGAQNYAVLEAIATGHTKLSEIASYIGLPATSAGAFLDPLCNYNEIIEKELPLLRPKAKDTRYSIKNPLFRFWFKFVYPNKGFYEVGKYDEFKKKLKIEFNSYCGREFERLAKEHLIGMAKRGLLDVSQVGGWWHKDREIDLVALGKENSAWECKWADVDEKEAGQIAAKLKENAAAAGIKEPKLGLFARSFAGNAGRHFDYAFELRDMCKEYW